MPALWQLARPLAEADRPPWLDSDEIELYRTFAAVDPQSLSDAERALWQAELDELELAKLFLDDEVEEQQEKSLRLFMPAPLPEPIWSIGIYQGQSLFDLRPATAANPVLTAEHMTDLTASYVADPFMAPHGDKWFMFFEAWNWHERKGEIVLATSDDALRWKYEQSVLAEPFHLSYPHVFSDAGEWYMVPESHQAGGVRLYRSKQFPYEWELVGEILTGPYFADSTLFRHGDVWWLFTDAKAETNDTLRLFYSEALLGPWKEHPCSPIVQGDPSCARPAGKVLLLPQDTKAPNLVRFAQNCQPHYGTDVRAVEIMSLTATDYAERPVLGRPLLGPSAHGWNARGMHHVDLHRMQSGWIATVDGWTDLPDITEAT